MGRRTEQDLTAECIAALRGLGLTAWRSQSGTVKVRGAYMHLAPKGTPDILARLRDGRMLGVETKASHKDGCRCESCEAQRTWRVQHERDGAPYVHARSVEQMLAAVLPLVRGAA